MASFIAKGLTLENVHDVVACLNEELSQKVYQLRPLHPSKGEAQDMETLATAQISYGSNGDLVHVDFLGMMIWRSDEAPQDDDGEPIDFDFILVLRTKIIYFLEVLRRVKMNPW